YDVYFPGQDALHPPRLLAPEKCADAVLRIVNGDYEAFRKNAFEHVKSNFDASAFMSDFNSTISEILDASRA
ncbi:lipopolysaccharide biosynthesis protein, partial [Klebsiella pneumoniae]|nr:lipopolysaccharide biosynthesis protein [Klebsiella pneumoniae]